jgi:hypothetical protein
MILTSALLFSFILQALLLLEFLLLFMVSGLIILGGIGTISQIISEPQNKNEDVLITGIREIREGMNYLKESTKEVYNYFTASKDADQSFIKDLSNSWKKLNDGLIQIGEKVEKFLANPIGNTKEFFCNIISALTKLIGKACDKTQQLCEGAIKSVKRCFEKRPDIKKLNQALNRTSIETSI